MTVPAVEADGVSKGFGGFAAVGEVSFVLEPGETLSVLGPSGAGKTTLLRLIAGFEQVEDGVIRINGRTASSTADHVPPERRSVGMVFQEFALFPHLTVSQNVAFGLKGLPSERKAERLAEVLALVRLEGLEGRYPHELSGGQQQRVALARTLAPRPVVVLLDEPFSNLDAALRTAVRSEVRDILRDHSITTIFVTHDRGDAFALADRIAVMRDGRFQQLDTPDALYHSPATPFVATVTGEADFLPVEVNAGTASTEIGQLPCGDAPESGQGSLLVREDDLEILADPQGQSEVVEREFRGDGIVLTVRLPAGSTVGCRQHHFSKISTGDPVTVRPSRAEPFIVFDERVE